MVYAFTTAGVLLCMQVLGFLVGVLLVFIFGIRTLVHRSADTDGRKSPDVDMCISMFIVLLAYVLLLSVLHMWPVLFGLPQPQVTPQPAIIAIPVEPAKVPPVRRPQHVPTA